MLSFDESIHRTETINSVLLGVFSVGPQAPEAMARPAWEQVENILGMEVPWICFPSPPHFEMCRLHTTMSCITEARCSSSVHHPGAREAEVRGSRQI